MDSVAPMTLRDDAACLVLSDAPVWRSVVEGYAGRESYLPGETVTLHCSSAVSSFDVTVTRVGSDRTVVWHTSGVLGELRDIPDDSYASGCGWPATVKVPIGADWAPGFYEVRFTWPEAAQTPDMGTYACFIVRSGSPSPDMPLLVLATSTWQSYNEWGGAGLYRGSPVVSLDRPYERGFIFKRGDLPEVRVVDTGTDPDPRQLALRHYLDSAGYGLRSTNAGWFQWERRFVAWAENNGYSLDFAASSDLEFNPDILDGRRLVLSVGHDEYWSTGMRNAVETFTRNGGNAAFFSGDICTSKIRYTEDGRTWSSYVMSGDKTTDPVWPDGDVTGFWSDPDFERPETQMTGVSTIFAGYARFGRSTPRGARGFLVQQPQHWVFDGTDVMWGDAIGVDGCLAGFEMCGCDVELRANRLVPTGRFGTPRGADIIAAIPAHLWRAKESSDLFDEEGIWDDSVLLAANVLYGDEPPADAIERLSNGWATMILTEPGGTVFSAATTEWAYCLDDAIIARMTTNILDRFLQLKD